MLARRLAISGLACDAYHIHPKTVRPWLWPLAWRVAQATRLIFALSDPLGSVPRLAGCWRPRQHSVLAVAARKGARRRG